MSMTIDGIDIPREIEAEGGDAIEAYIAKDPERVATRERFYAEHKAQLERERLEREAAEKEAGDQKPGKKKAPKNTDSEA